MRKLDFSGTYIDYEDLLDSFEYDVVLSADDNDYQGDSYRVFKNGNMYGLLVFGWGSCSGCDALQDADESPNREMEVLGLRSDLHDSIIWNSFEDMAEYVQNKDFEGEFYYHTWEGRKFVNDLKELFHMVK